MSRLFRRHRRQRGFTPALQQLEDRCMLTVQLEFVPSTGSIFSEGNDSVLELAPGGNVDITSFATASPTEAAVAFQLNFANSASELVFSNYSSHSAWQPLEGSGENVLFGGRRQSSVLNIGTTPVELGTYNVAVPFTGGDYLLTVAGVTGAFATVIDIGEGQENVPTIDDHGDLILRVPNFAPDLGSESYDTTQNGQLSVNAANGVLANDSDQNNDALSVDVDVDVAFGSLSLQQDGSFTYQPNDGFHGTDSFTYVVSDGTKTSTSTVDIRVAATTPWRNPVDIYDVNDDGSENAQDVLVMINYINANLNDAALDPPRGSDGSPPPYLDITGDNRITVRDVLVAVNELNRRLADAQGEGIDVAQSQPATGLTTEEEPLNRQVPALIQPVEPGIVPVESNDENDSSDLSSTGEFADEEVELVIDVIAADVAQVFTD